MVSEIQDDTLQPDRAVPGDQGVVLSAVVISGVLLGQAAQAAPPGLVASLAGAAGRATVSGTAVLLVQAGLRRLRWRRVRRVSAMAACLLLLLPSIGSERVATNIMMAKYPLHLVKVRGTWKWDLPGGLSREVREQRLAVLGRKARLLEALALQIRNGTVTNVSEILQAVQGTEP